MPRLLIVGIDGLPPALLERLLSEGRLPALAALARRGCLGVLRSTPNYQSASAWTSLVTGVNPGKHGILHFTNPVRGDYGVAQIDAGARRCPSVWRLLSDAGAKVAALNLPVSFPAEDVRGVMVAGWLCPSLDTVGFTQPPDLAGEIARRFGDYPIHPDVRRHAAAGHFDRAAAAATHGIDVKGRVARWLLERERPDVLGAVFTECDSLQHWCWHILDEGHPEHDASLAERWLDALLGVYEAADRQVAALLDAAGEDVDVLVVSDHGQAPNSGAQVLLRPWLMAAGYLVPRRRSALRRALDRVVSAGFELAKNRAPGRLKALLRSRLPGLQTRAQAGTRAMATDWARTRAWTEAGHVFVNLRGRQPEGVVEPGEECERLLSELEGELASLVDAESGEPVVAATTRGAEEFHGPHADIMPDLLVHWRNERRVTAVRRRGQVIVHPSPPRLPTGAHHPDGTLLAAGPSFRTGVRPVAQSICDVAPTVLHLSGQAVPSYMDGEVMVGLLTPDAAQDVRTVAVNLPTGAANGGAAPDGDEIVARRLRSLGYIE